MKKTYDLSKVPLDKWGDLFMAMFEAAKPTIPKQIRAVYEDIVDIATLHEKEESDIDKEIADKLSTLSPEEVAELLWIPDILYLIEQKRSIRSRTEKDFGGQKERDGENQG